MYVKEKLIITGRCTSSLLDGRRPGRSSTGNKELLIAIKGTGENHDGRQGSQTGPNFREMPFQPEFFKDVLLLQGKY